MTCPLKSIIEALGDSPVGKKLAGIVDNAGVVTSNKEAVDLEALVGIPKRETPRFDALPEWNGLSGTYAGIGSSRTPKEVQLLMNEAAKMLEEAGYTLRSGAAIGADKAFEGAPQPWEKNGNEVSKWSSYKHKTAKKEIYRDTDATDETREIAKEMHPNPKALKEKGLNLMARSTFQVFGKDLDNPVDFVLAWTPNNSSGEIVTTHAQRDYDPEKANKLARGESSYDTGGTGQAISMADLKGIPVINMADPKWKEQLTIAMDKAKAAKERVDAPDVAGVEKGVDTFTVPEDIKALKENEVFVFGSNRAGRHGKGAALTAKQLFGAKDGVGTGASGNSYALPTKDHKLNPIPYEELATEIEDFVEYAERNPNKTFLVTAIGTGLAGMKPEHVLYYFSNIPTNIKLPKKWAGLQASNPQAENKIKDDTISLETLGTDVVSALNNACKV